MRIFKYITLIAAIGCLFKAALAIYYFYGRAFDNEFVKIYYFSDIILWVGIAVFLFHYYSMMKHSKKIDKSDPRLERLFDFL